MSGNLKEDALRKRKSRENETLDQRQKRLARDRENKAKRKNEESAEERKEHLDKEKKQKQQHRALNNLDVTGGRLNDQENEQTDKNIPKKFSAENNIDPGDVPEELQGLTEIEKMLIAQIFLVILVYCLREGQYAYKRNVINFPQDVHEFVTHLPRHPSSLDVLVVRRQFLSGPAFRDFNVRYVKVARVLLWLKANNRYYTNIDIDNEALQLLPENGTIDNHLQQILNRILCNSNPNDLLLASFQKLLLYTVAERDISVQETCYHLLGIPLYHSCC
ncbi:17156_t:CDS:2 [Racocetra fulgida]|uniref:17156_t:CDS:1 n=1 Tax=Racocetra fulgida TaxID=60492 RepID=A0A9N9B7F7_9GLOM|nr:17156_t:CDS:2 [Racocetra fulgida]